MVGPLLYQRPFGYGPHEVVRQLYQLQKWSGDSEATRQIFVRALVYNVGAATVYVAVLIGCLKATGIAYPWWLLYGLPLAGWSAACFEALQLKRLVLAYDELGNRPGYGAALDAVTQAHPGVIGGAGRATRTKLMSVGLVLAVLAVPGAELVRLLGLVVVTTLLVVLAVRAAVTGARRLAAGWGT